MLNVAAGGTLVQDLPGVSDSLHRDAERFGEVVHPVDLDPACRVAAVMGGHQVGVNTLHHQAVDRVGDGLRAVGWATDGTFVNVVPFADRVALPLIGFHDLTRERLAHGHAFAGIGKIHQPAQGQ
jgi:putative glutamine amidotransferase